jgi:branched-chain amino acid transport system permease protein
MGKGRRLTVNTQENLIDQLLLQAWLPPDLRPFRDAFVFGFVIAVLLFRPEGLARPRAMRERV